MKRILFLTLAVLTAFVACKTDEPEPDSGTVVIVPGDDDPKPDDPDPEDPQPTGEYNVYGKVICDGVGVSGVLVSDGVEIVQTDAEGNYRLQSDKEMKYVFMTVPSGYEAASTGVLPRIHQMLTADVDTKEEIDFELYREPNDDFTLFLLGDIHLARRNSDLEQFGKVAKTLNDCISAAPGKVYVLTLGDMTWDLYWLSNNYGFSHYLETVNSHFHDIPFFHTIGNHDNEMEVGGDLTKSFKYTENLAPDYYSFNLGKIHFIVLDNMDFTDVEAGESHRGEYRKRFTAQQLEWLRKDLSYVDKSTPVFVSAHEPISRPDGISWGEELGGLADFIGIFDGFKVQFLSGHTHHIFNRRYADNFVEYNAGALCAGWWWSGYLTPGIHVSSDGSPGGFSIWSFNGTEYRHSYRAAGQSPDYQFRAYDMNKVKELFPADLSDHSKYPKYYNHIQGYAENDILVNVWDYGEGWSVSIAENGSPLQVTEVGAYDPLHILAMTVPRLNNYNTTTFSTASWRHFFKATASSASSEVTVTVKDANGRTYTETMTRPKAFVMGEYKNEVVRVKPQAECVSASSSTLSFGWTTGGTPAEDADESYKIALYKDSGCSQLVTSFEIPEGSSCWDGQRLRFVFGGLTPSTTYWFKVDDLSSGMSSDPVAGETADFSVVVPSAVSNAGAGDVILAEDFSEIAWGSDQFSVAAGWFPSVRELSVPSGALDTGSGSFKPYDSTDGRLYGNARVTSDKRLYGWGFFGNSSVYSFAGYVRVGSASSNARTHIVSPALSGIPDGVTATVDVSVTSSKLESSENDVAVFVENRSALTLVLAPDQKENSKFSGSGGKYTGASLAKGYPLEADVKSWSTKTVRIEGVTNKDCLLFGSLDNIDTKNRFCLSDVVVKIVDMEEPPAPSPVEAGFETASSSTLSFTWTEGVSAADDIAKPWTITLYKDEACTVQEAAFSIPAGAGCWNGKQPKFVFSGLKPATSYWFKAVDTTEGAVKESGVVKATTKAFTVVDPASVAEVAVGTVILAEDFSEMCWGCDLPDGAAGYNAADGTDPVTSRNVQDYVVSSTTTSEKQVSKNVYNSSGVRLLNWALGKNNNLYIHPGYIKFSTNSTNNSHIITPALTCIPEGMTATVNVTVTAAGWGGSYKMIAAVQHSNAADIKDMSVASGQVNTVSFDNVGTITLNGGGLKWSTQTITLEGVVKGDRIAVGTTETVTKGAGRLMLSDVVITVAGLEDSGRTTRVSIIGDSISTFAGWCDTSKGAAYYPKSDCDVSEVDKTWWYKLIYSKMSTGKFEKNISAGNTTVVQNSTGDSSAYWYGWDFGTRLVQLGLGNPDVVFIHGGTNDYGHTLYNGTSEELISGVAMGSESFPESARTALQALFSAADAATTAAAADALDGSTFCSAYIRLVKMIQTRHPSARIVCVIGDYLYAGQGQAIRLIAQHFGQDRVRTADILGQYGYQANGTITKYGYAHPDANGMNVMADYIYQQVGAWIDNN